jgi:protein TonB
MKTLRSMDSPWRRLPWTLPTALLLWAIALWGLAYFMGKPTSRQVEPPPIDAQLIEQPVSPATQSIQPKPPAAVHQPKTLPTVRPQKTPVMPQASPRTEQNPITHKTEAISNAPAASAPVGASAAPGEGRAGAAVITSPNGSAQIGSYGGKGSSHGNMNANSGARAIFRPMPQIPDDLREGAFNSAALARFHIAIDGSVTVELAKPTPNPRLNRVLLNTLNKWRFIPAIKNGKVEASTEEIVIKIEVK